MGTEPQTSECYGDGWWSQLQGNVRVLGATELCTRTTVGFVICVLAQLKYLIPKKTEKEEKGTKEQVEHVENK